MHFLMGAFLHTLVGAVLAFFVLFAASKADGFVKLLGTILGWIILLGALLGLLAAVYGAATGKHPLEGMHHGWMMRFHDGDADNQAPPPAAAPAPATPAPAPAAPQSPPPKPK